MAADGRVEPAVAGQPTLSGQGMNTPASKIDERWMAVRDPQYAIQSVKKAALQGRTRPKWHASGDYGHQWGSAVHELLETAVAAPTADLHSTALLLTEQHELGSERVDELIATARSVMASDVWRRAQSAKRCLSELSLETLSHDGQGRPVIVRGVIDLIFEEPAGWIIVDYKTDDITDADVAGAVEYYRGQLEHYARHWVNITGHATAELGLYFTRIDRYVPCPVSSNFRIHVGE